MRIHTPAESLDHIVMDVFTRSHLSLPGNDQKVLTGEHRRIDEPFE